MLLIYFKHLEIQTVPVADPEFTRGWNASPLGGGGTIIWFCQIFPKIAWKNLDLKGEVRKQNFTMYIHQCVPETPPPVCFLFLGGEGIRGAHSECRVYIVYFSSLVYPEI